VNQSDSSAVVIPAIFGILIAIFMIAALWKVFTKAGRPGWAAIIPIYNAYVQIKIVGRPGWWLILLFIPLANIVVSLVLAFDLAKSFGKGGAFGFFGLWLFGIIGYPMLGFGSATYQGPSAV
jgi:hypothetical protein